MTLYTQTAQDQLHALEQHYAALGRSQAIRNLAHALAEASLVMLNAPHLGLPAPRPYPTQARPGLFWLKRGRYWISFRLPGPTITGIFFDQADIPGQLR